MKSQTIKIYKKFIASATQDQIDFVDQVYATCEENYSQGGDTIVECFSPHEIIEQFKTIKAVQEYYQLRAEAATNARWGEDNEL